MPELNPDQLGETVQALYARLSETRAYLRGYDCMTDGVHDDCCPRHQSWLRSRTAERDSLRKRETDVLGALMALDPEDGEDA